MCKTIGFLLEMPALLRYGALLKCLSIGGLEVRRVAFQR